MDPTPTPRRRWFRFSLRTLFVATALLSIVAGVVGYHLNWIRQRRAVVKSWQNPLVSTGPIGPILNPKAPGLLGLFGERGYGSLRKGVLIEFDVRSPEYVKELNQVKKLFPEATDIRFIPTWIPTWIVEPEDELRRP